MFTPFRLKQTIGEAYSMDLEDSLNTKKALARLGHLEEPEDGFDEYPDRPMIEAVRSFQRANDLVEDGVMKPDGPTIARLNESLVARQERVPPPPGVIVINPDTDRERAPAASPASLLAYEPGDPYRRHLDSLPVRPGTPPTRPQSKKDPKGVQVALAPAVVALAPVLGAAARLVLGQAARKVVGAGSAVAAGAAGAAALKGDQKPAGNARSDILPPMPPLPGFEPAPEELRKPQRTEFPAETIILPDLVQPVPETTKPTIFIFPMPDEDLRNAGLIVEDRRGNFATKAEIERIQAWIETNHPDWDHKGGGVNRLKGGLLSEHWIPSVAKSFGGDGRPGGTYVDLSFQTPSGKWVHVQTVDVDPKTGKVTQAELDAADRIRRSGKNIDVILIPKGVQIEKYNKRFKGN